MNPHPESPGWFQVWVRIRPQWLELVSAWFFQAGCLGLELLDADHINPPADLDPKQVEVRASFGGSSDPEVLQQGWTGFVDSIQVDLPDEEAPASLCRIQPVSQEDWANNWRRHFEPVRAGRIFVHPPWIEVPADARWPVCIDPGMAFGTGMHPTTRLCLQAVDRCLPAESFLDVGCGSGVLALAACRAGVERVVALDNDSTACQVARENAQDNGLGGPLRVVHGEVSAISGQYQVIAANILSSVLCDIAEQLVARLAPGGQLLLSGILNREASDLARVFVGAGLEEKYREALGEWSLLHFWAPYSP